MRRTPEPRGRPFHGNQERLESFLWDGDAVIGQSCDVGIDGLADGADCLLARSSLADAAR